MSDLDVIRRVVAAERDALSRLIDAIPAQVGELLDLLERLTCRLIVVGLGKSGIAGRKIVATFNSTGVAAVFLHPIDAMHGDLGIVSGNDLAFCISHSGETDEVISLIPHFERLGVTNVSITSRADSTLAKLTQLALIVPHDVDSGLISTTLAKLPRGNRPSAVNACLRKPRRSLELRVPKA